MLRPLKRLRPDAARKPRRNGLKRRNSLNRKSCLRRFAPRLLQAAIFAKASRVMFSGFDAVVTTLSSMRMPP